MAGDVSVRGFDGTHLCPDVQESRSSHQLLPAGGVCKSTDDRCIFLCVRSIGENFVSAKSTGNIFYIVELIL